MPAFDNVLNKARATPRRIVLPEAQDDRILKAAATAAADQCCWVIRQN